MTIQEAIKSGKLFMKTEEEGLPAIGWFYIEAKNRAEFFCYINRMYPKDSKSTNWIVREE